MRLNLHVRAPRQNLVQRYHDQYLDDHLRNFRVSGGTPAIRITHSIGDSDTKDYFLAVLHITRLPKDESQRASIGRNYDNYA